MKKVFLSGIMLIGLAFTAQAQDFSKNALGLRLGSNDGFGTEISYQRGLSSDNRLEVDFGWRNNNDSDSIKLTGLYQWVWNIEGGFNWYAGVGGGLGTWSSNDENYNGNDGAFVFGAGDIGIEYNFEEAPIQLSLDGRPELGFSDFNDGLDFDIAFGIRYRF